MFGFMGIIPLPVYVFFPTIPILLRKGAVFFETETGTKGVAVTRDRIPILSVPFSLHPSLFGRNSFWRNFESILWNFDRYIRSNIRHFSLDWPKVG